MQLAMQVLQQLAKTRAAETGARQFVSGAELATQFGVTRSAIWKAIGQLRELDTGIEALTHRGYRLVLPTTPLAVQAVQALLRPDVRASLRQGECAGALDSTNSQLLARGAPPSGQFDFLTAEFQSAGRGRRGRTWLAPPGSAVCLSWSWCFEGLPSAMGALSLAVGVAARRALRGLHIDDVRLKWPNDLVVPEGKLGGILIEMRTESAGPVHVIIGIGLNVALDAKLRARLRDDGTQAADLSALVAPAAAPARSELVAALLNEGVAVVREFARAGFAPFRDEFQAADALRECPVTLQGSGSVSGGMARGVDMDGALLVAHQGQIHRIIAGEVSVRTTSS
jgi:BirA family biotin operon repressor/biotin-[acetyl-CoA-carboxylase] ligase